MTWNNLDHRLLLPLVGQANAALARDDGLLPRSMKCRSEMLEESERASREFVECLSSTISCPATNPARRWQHD